MRIVRYRQQGSAQFRLFCFPFAGGGVSVFNSWPGELPSHVEICSVELPGRDSLINERPHTDFSSLISELEDTLATALDRPYVIFGHSLGALIGFELCRALRRSGRRQPRLLVLSGHGAPQLAKRRLPIHHLAKGRFVREMRRLQGTPPAVLENAELLELVLPILRADFQLHHSYEYYEEEPLDVPLVGFGGESDHEVLPPDLAAWGDHTRGGFRLQLFPGGHFFLLSEQQRVLRALVTLLPGESAASRQQICWP